MSTNIIQKSFKHTTQYARVPTGIMLKKTFSFPNPALDVFGRNEDVACDIVYSDVLAIFDGSTAVVIFVGTSTMVTDVYSIKCDRQFTNTLELILSNEGLPIDYLVTVVRLLLAIKERLPYIHYVSTNRTTRIF
jgi:hypothetical protein